MNTNANEKERALQKGDYVVIGDWPNRLFQVTKIEGEHFCFKLDGKTKRLHRTRVVRLATELEAIERKVLGQT